ncbi:MAG TPA: hypothetical protein VFI49_00070 [Rudaea sp.]|nr:hypothetical protein [Rudaea sp.]
MFRSFGLFGVRFTFFSVSLALVALLACPVSAAQFDIQGPPGSMYFGASVTVLPNGNLVVTDYGAKNAGGDGVGAVYLYDPQGSPISVLTGSVQDDLWGVQITVLPSGNFVVVSDAWNNGPVHAAGAVTWVNGSMGLSGEVSSANSLVGTHYGDLVGAGGVVVLANGNYLVASDAWNGTRGAVTWANGDGGLSGEVSSENSLVGSASGDLVGIRYVGSIVALANGNYVVGSPEWSDVAGEGGAATWGDGTHGVTGEISASNSLLGSSEGDFVGFSIAALTNGNYVVASPGWSNGPVLHVGASTWANGANGIIGEVSAANSLIGSTANDKVASGTSAGLANQSIVPLANGNYVVCSASWNIAGAAQVGAATWGEGSTGIVGVVSPGNSLVGSTAEDRVCAGGVAALSNGNYVVQSHLWNAPGLAEAGAATWSNGSSGFAGVVSATNSLVGNAVSQHVGSVVTPLANGNYVVGRTNSQYGLYGSVTWANGLVGITGSIDFTNSLLSTDVTNAVGYVQALANGNYVVVSPNWGDGRGAVTWASGTAPITGTIGPQNSFVGAGADKIGDGGIYPFSDGSYAILSRMSDNSGTVTYSRGSGALLGSPTAFNSLYGVGYQVAVAYDSLRKRLIVGMGYNKNTVTVRDVDELFANGFD